VYAWTWRKLPGNAYAKLSQSLVLLVAVGALLWYVIFPWATPLLPFDDVQVSDGTNQSGPAQQDPNAVIPGDDGAPDNIPYNQHSNDPEPTRSR
jgi:cytoskeletal protein RodZ